MDDPIDLINEYIVTNHNNEITAAVLNPVLQAIVLEYRDFIGDLNLLTTPVTEDVVGAINSLQQQITDFDYTGVEVHSGIDDPNTTPPLTYAVADFYNQVDGGGDTVALWQYSGTEWVNLSVPTVGSLQQVTDVGAITDNPITVGSETDNIVIDTARIEMNKSGFVTRITFDDPTGAFSANIRALTSDEEVAFLSDITPVSSGNFKRIGKGWVGTVANEADEDEVGDIFQGSAFDVGDDKWYWYAAAQWTGGDTTDIANFNWSSRDTFI